KADRRRHRRGARRAHPRIWTPFGGVCRIDGEGGRRHRRGRPGRRSGAYAWRRERLAGGRQDPQSVAGEELMPKEASQSGGSSRLWLRASVWMFLILAGVTVARALSRAALENPHFVLDRDAGVAANSRDFVILGLRQASRDRMLRVFAGDFGRNIFEIPIDERRRKLLAVDWVERASVSRIWPNQIVVRIWERTPVAFVSLTSDATHNRNSRLALIDAFGVILDRPERLDFSSPILSGVYESQSEGERQERMRRYSRLMNELGRPLSKQISEVD